MSGALIALGLFTRPTEFVASGTMAAAHSLSHAPLSFYPVNNGGDAAVLYCFIFLYFVFAGAGPLSLNGRLYRGAVTDADNAIEQELI